MRGRQGPIWNSLRICRRCRAGRGYKKSWYSPRIFSALSSGTWLQEDLEVVFLRSCRCGRAPHAPGDHVPCVQRVISQKGGAEYCGAGFQASLRVGPSASYAASAAPWNLSLSAQKNSWTPRGRRRRIFLCCCYSSNVVYPEYNPSGFFLRFTSISSYLLFFIRRRSSTIPTSSSSSFKSSSSTDGLHLPFNKMVQLAGLFIPITCWVFSL